MDSRTWLAAAGVAACCSSLQTRAADWDQFRGPAGNGRALATSLPVAWSETENVVWKVPIEGKAWSSPVVADGIIWLTNATEDGRRLSIVALDAASGERLHDLTIFEIAEPAFCHAFNSYASPTPVVADGRLWVHYGSAGTACLSTATGEVLWTRQDLPCDHHRGAGSSPILVDGLLVLTFDGFDRQYVAALDASTGQTVWQTDRSIDYGTDDGDMKKAYSTPTAFEHAGRKQVVSPSAVATIAYDPATGDELWRVVHGGFNAACRPLYADGLVVICIAAGRCAAGRSAGGFRRHHRQSGGVAGREGLRRRGRASVWWARASTWSATPAFSAVSTWPLASRGGPNAAAAATPPHSSRAAAGSTHLMKTAAASCSQQMPMALCCSGKTSSRPAAWPPQPSADDDLIVRTKTHCYRLGRAASPPSQ